MAESWSSNKDCSDTKLLEDSVKVPFYLPSRSSNHAIKYATTIWAEYIQHKTAILRQAVQKQRPLVVALSSSPLRHEASTSHLGTSIGCFAALFRTQQTLNFWREDTHMQTLTSYVDERPVIRWRNYYMTSHAKRPTNNAVRSAGIESVNVGRRTNTIIFEQDQHLSWKT